MRFFFLRNNYFDVPTRAREVFRTNGTDTAERPGSGSHLDRADRETGRRERKEICCRHAFCFGEAETRISKEKYRGLVYISRIYTTVIYLKEKGNTFTQGTYFLIDR